MQIICVKDNVNNCDRCYKDMLLSNKVSAYYDAIKQLEQFKKWIAQLQTQELPLSQGL